MNQSAIQHDEYSYNFFYTDMGKGKYYRQFKDACLNVIF